MLLFDSDPRLAALTACAAMDYLQTRDAVSYQPRLVLTALSRLAEKRRTVFWIAPTDV